MPRTVSVIVPDDLLDDLYLLSDISGLGRSTLIVQMISETVKAMAAAIREVPDLEKIEKKDIKRLRGRSEALVEERIKEFEKLSNDLFSDI